MHELARIPTATADALRGRDELYNSDGTKCGLCTFYPKFMQRLATPKSFLVCFCIKNVLQGMIFTYLVGIETSLERHFQFDGRAIGLLLTLGEIGPIITAIWISHLGSRGNRPRWMALGMLLIAVSLLLCYAMNLLFPPLRLPASHSHILDRDLSPLEAAAVKVICRKMEDDNTTASLSLLKPECSIDAVRRQWAFAAWVFVYSLMGIGGTTVYVIGAPYLDDSISSKDSPFYFSITISVRIIGPVFGYLLSSACLKVYVDVYTSPSWKSDDPRWIGAWWLGALIIAVLMLLYALVLGCFPRNMRKTEGKRDDDMPDIAPKSGTSTITSSRATLNTGDEVPLSRKERIADFKAAILRLLRNPILVCSCGSSIFTILGLAGYFIWLPKYFEHEYRLSKSRAAMYSGLAGNLSMIAGVLLSGYLMKRCSPTARQVAALVAISKYIYAFGLVVIMFLGCNFSSDLPGNTQADGSLKLNRECNEACTCSTAEFVPVCLRGQRGEQTYFSPCHAGCSEFTAAVNGSTIYSSCACDLVSNVTTGYCAGSCSNLYIYMAILAFIKLVVSLSTVGNLIIDLRCVHENDKALALGILAAVAGLLGFLPNPIIYGSLIDSSCLVWEISCGQTGSCWVYDTDKFRYILHGLTSACLMVAGAFEWVTFCKVKNLKLFDVG